MKTAVAGMEDGGEGLTTQCSSAEVNHTAEGGTELLNGFILGVCVSVSRTGRMDSFMRRKSQRSARRWGDGRCYLRSLAALIPSVVAALLAKAIGKQLTCVFVDTDYSVGRG